MSINSYHGDIYMQMITMVINETSTRVNGFHGDVDIQEYMVTMVMYICTLV